MMPAASFRLALCAIITAAVAATTADAGRFVYQAISGMAPVNWSVSGRWFLMVLSGQPFVPDMAAAPALPHELLAGHAAYYTISLVFAAAYLLLLDRVWKHPPSLLNGLAFGWVTMIFPFFIQMPAMGMGVFASHTATPLLIVLRTLVHHSSFGLGLALGAMAAGRIMGPWHRAA
ncbi:DUF2938 family protein [Aestuariivirga sp.]|jgi:hypothetical protein|uniref:DUF2938 family protein n=1 Tax=Aestuariivirga sp. TaxID=2650926 RepID=UPI00378331AA